MAKWKTPRQAIVEALKRRGKSSYWLAEEMSPTISRTAIYGFLRGSKGISLANLQQLLTKLGLRITDE